MELLSYDIFDTRIRNKFRKYLISIGFVEVQKSLYFSINKTKQKDIEELEKLINPIPKSRFIILPCKKENIKKYRGSTDISSNQRSFVF